MSHVFEHILIQGEQILWAGQGERKLFSAIDIFLVPFSIVWGGFAIVWEVMALTVFSDPKAGPVGFIFPLFGIPFVVIGLYFMVGRFWYKDWRRRNTFYAVTNLRILILYRRQLQSLYVDSLPLIDLSVDPRTGTGTLRFGQMPFFGAMYANTGLEFMNLWGGSVPAFVNIPGANQVYGLITQLRRQPRA